MEFGKVIKTKWLRRLVGFIVLFIFFSLTSYFVRDPVLNFISKYKAVCYEDKDGDGFGAFDVEPILCFFWCRKNHVKNNLDIDDANNACRTKEDEGCKDFEVSKFTISKHECLDSVQSIQVEIENIGSVVIDTIIILWDSNIEDTENIIFADSIIMLKVNEKELKYFGLKNTNLSPGQYKSALNVMDISTKDTLKLEEVYTIERCRTQSLLKPLLAGDSIRITYVVNNISYPAKSKKIHRETSCISFPENLTSFKLEKLIDGLWAKIFPDFRLVVDPIIPKTGILSLPGDRITLVPQNNKLSRIEEKKSKKDNKLPINKQAKKANLISMVNNSQEQSTNIQNDNEFNHIETTQEKIKEIKLTNIHPLNTEDAAITNAKKSLVIPQPCINEWSVEPSGKDQKEALKLNINQLNHTIDTININLNNAVILSKSTDIKKHEMQLKKLCRMWYYKVRHQDK